MYSNHHLVIHFSGRGLLISLAAIMCSCAQMVVPTGGPKETVAPKVEKTIPENKTVLFNEKRIIVKFDEYIVLNNPGEQIVISPSTEEKPTFDVLGKSVVISFKKGLLPNTTYTINFGNSIGDLHENNLLSDYRYVFSTGHYLDSAKVAGICQNAFNNLPEKDILIGLYYTGDFEDSSIYKRKPVYFGKTKNNGSFIIENVPDTSFRMVAFKDENKNLKYDKNEWIGFCPSPVIPSDTNITSYKLFLYKPDAFEKGRILDTFSREAGKFVFVTYKRPALNLIPKTNNKYIIWKDKGTEGVDTFNLFIAQKDSLLSFYQDNSDTPALSIKTKKGGRLPAFLSMLDKKAELNDSVKVKFTSPLERYDTTKLILKEDSLIVTPVYTLSQDRRLLSAYFPWKEKTRYSFEIKDSSFTGIYHQMNKSDKFIWASKTQRDYGSLQLTIINADPDNAMIMQLVNENESTVYKEFLFSGTKEFFLDYMLPATYKIKFIVDENKNGVWDNGDYFLKRLAERVYYYPEKITLRAYWDMELHVDLKVITR